MCYVSQILLLHNVHCIVHIKAWRFFTCLPTCMCLCLHASMFAATCKTRGWHWVFFSWSLPSIDRVSHSTWISSILLGFLDSKPHCYSCLYFPIQVAIDSLFYTASRDPSPGLQIKSHKLNQPHHLIIYPPLFFFYFDFLK